MFRYLGFIWDCGSGTQSETVRFLARRLKSSSPDWRTAAHCNGLWLFTAGSDGGSATCTPLSRDFGAVLGTVFERDQPRRATFGPSAAERIVLSRGRELFRSYWGRYVAFLVDPASGRKWIVRDPTGGLPCFSVRHQGIIVAFSRAEDYLPLQLPRLSVNWNFIKNRVAIGPARSRGCALHEVAALDSGECAAITSDQKLTRQYYWTPSAIARMEPVEDIARATELLRATAIQCVAAWASCYDSVILRLSGGLDSSVVLGCLRAAPSKPRVTALVYYSRHGAASDERPFAELAARHAGLELRAQDRSDLRIRLEDLLRVAPSINPPDHLAHLEVGPPERLLARELQAQAVFSGDGGDPLFARHVRMLTVADYAHRHGIRREAFRIASRMAPETPVSFWKILNTAWRHKLRILKATPGGRIASRRELIGSSLREYANGQSLYGHPWFRDLDDIGPGKALQTRLMLISEAPAYDPLAEPDDPEEVYPLRSQPLVELALRIPTYVLLHNGRERGLAREAFQPDVPAEILTRYWKGRPSSLLDEHLMRNIRFVREVLLDGALVKQRLLDRAALEKALAGPTRRAGSTIEIFEHVLTECWVQRWLQVA